MITATAYETLEYYELALQELKNSCFFSDDKIWRLRWFNCICLLRIALYVAIKEITDANFKRKMNTKWNESKIAKNLKNYRDLLLHEFKFNKMQPQLLTTDHELNLTTEDGKALSTGQICMDDDKSVWEFLDETYQWVKNYIDEINCTRPS